MPKRGRRVHACLCADWHAQSLRRERTEALTMDDSATSIVTRTPSASWSLTALPGLHLDGPAPRRSPRRRRAGKEQGQLKSECPRLVGNPRCGCLTGLAGWHASGDSDDGWAEPVRPVLTSVR